MIINSDMSIDRTQEVKDRLISMALQRLPLRYAFSTWSENFNEIYDDMNSLLETDLKAFMEKYL